MRCYEDNENWFSHTPFKFSIPIYVNCVLDQRGALEPHRNFESKSISISIRHTLDGHVPVSVGLGDSLTHFADTQPPAICKDSPLQFTEMLPSAICRDFWRAESIIESNILIPKCYLYGFGYLGVVSVGTRPLNIKFITITRGRWALENICMGAFHASGLNC
jgi:hypothetical protein